MLLLLSSSLAHAANPAAIGLVTVPETPDGKLVGTHKERLAAIEAGELPERLIPFHYEDVGTGVSGVKWHDGEGHVWTRSEALAILAADPTSAALAKNNAVLSGGATSLVIAGCAAEAVSIALLPVAAPFIAVGTGVLLQGGGVTMSVIGNDQLLTAVKAYNLAHAPEPVDGLVELDE